MIVYLHELYNKFTMKKHNKHSNFETALFKTLEYYNYSFPKTDREIEEYLNSDGLSKLEMPEKLSDPDTLYDNIMEKKNLGVSAIAAHDEKPGFKMTQDLFKKLDDSETLENEINHAKKRGKKN